MNITSYKRKNIHSGLKGETLSRSGLLSSQDRIVPMKIAPELNVVKIGGHGVIDYGAQAILPLVSEIKELCRTHQMLIMTGGGVRVRHIMDIGIDLGMPTGVLAELASKVSEQNAIMMSVLLSETGGEYISNTDLLDVLNLQKLGILPITAGTPPYGIFEIPPETGIIPQYRTDSGAVIAAEMLGAKSCILVKNCTGLFDKNPSLFEDAELIEEITARELIDMNMDDMVLEYKAVEVLSHCRNLKEIKILNGHNKGELTKVMNGGKPGTIIRR
ncbi:MAG: uridylate kinase [Methanocorpusculum sp.]|nr:uridylate kinase [Methanocorpusculum sp.]